MLLQKSATLTLNSEGFIVVAMLWKVCSTSKGFKNNIFISVEFLRLKKT